VTPYHPYSHIMLEWDFEPVRTPLARLASRCRVIRYDRRGTGLSDRDTELTAETEQSDLRAVVDAAAEQPVRLMGRGLGALAAIRFAASNAADAAALVLYDPLTSTDVLRMDPQLLARTAVIEALVERDVDALVDIVMPMSGGSEWWTAYFREATDQAHFRQMLSFTDNVADMLADVRCPTLVIKEADSGWSRTGDKVARSIRDCEFAAVTTIMPDAEMADVSVEVFAFFGLGTPPTSDDSIAQSRALRTILFTDLVGHTEMMSRLGDERGRAVLREHEAITRGVLKQHAGTEVKTMGDGFMASFASVTRAVECAVGLQRAFDVRNCGESAERGVGASHDSPLRASVSGQTPVEPLHIRVGLNAGEPIEEDGPDGRRDLFGATVILASRIAAKAEGGEILVADTVRGLCSGKGFLFADRGEFVAKGFEDPVRIYEVNWRA